MALVCCTSGTLRLLVLSTAVVLAGCATGSPAPTPAGPPESVEVSFRTDPVTGKTDGPFDPESGRRVETHIGDDGIMRVVIDPVTNLPRLLPDHPAEQPPRP